MVPGIAGIAGTAGTAGTAVVEPQKWVAMDLLGERT